MSSEFTFIDSVLVAIIAIVSLYVRLWTIERPSDVIFDEVHFGNFSKWYNTKYFHFDIHPPLAKLIMAYIAKSAQYKGDIQRFYKLGIPYEKNETHYITQRYIPAIFSAGVAPLIYCSLRNFAVSPICSLLGSIMLALDSSMIVESKFILTDGILHFFTALHIFAFSLFLRTEDNFHVLLAGITLGCASSCKFTALGLFALDGFSQIFWILIKRPDIVAIISRATLLLAPAAFVFFFSFVLHFALCPFAGKNAHYLEGPDKNTVFDFNKVNTSYWGNRLINSPLLLRTYRWIKVMHRINFRSNIPHPWQSYPEYWPFMTDKQILFYSKESHRRITCTGLPASYWPSTAGVILVPFLFLIRFADWRDLLFTFGWAVSYFPFIMVPRTMFNYHYLIPLEFTCANFGILIENVFSRRNSMRGFAATFFIITVILCYWFFCPIVYGTFAKDAINARRWLHQWNDGFKPALKYFNRVMYKTALMRTQLPKY